MPCPAAWAKAATSNESQGASASSKNSRFFPALQARAAVWMSAVATVHWP